MLFRREWPSGLRRCSKNWKIPGPNHNRRSVIEKQDRDAMD